MTRSQKTQAVQVVEAKSDQETLLESPLYGVAMLKVAMELKKPNARALDEILAGVLAKMGIDEVAFRRYLMKNGGLLRAIAQRKRY